jgi:hypothetical protein
MALMRAADALQEQREAKERALLGLDAPGGGGTTPGNEKFIN